MFDSLVNLSENVYIISVLKRLGTGGMSFNIDVTGDDVSSQHSNMVRCIMYVLAFQDLGCKIHPRKTWIDRKWNEYLRLVVKGRYMTGYPARSLLSIFWRNPVSSEAPRGTLRLAESLDRWLKLVKRGYSMESVYPHMLRDMSGGMGVSEETIDRWIHTPRTLGGGGLRPWTNKMVEATEAKMEIDYRIKDKVIGLDGLVYKICSETSLDVADLTKRAISFITKNVGPRGVSRVVVKPGRLKDRSELELPKKAKYSPGPRGAVTVARSKDVFGSLALECLSLYMTRDDRLNVIRGEWLSDDSLNVFDILKSKASIRVLDDWLFGRLPFHAPIHHQQGSLTCKVMFERVIGGHWGALLKQHKIGYDDVISVALQVEFDTIEALDRLQYVIGE
jgi:hypothetical protein